MTDIDPKALEHACQCAGRSVHHFDRMALGLPLRASIIAHARAIEQHEAFKREVSDAVGAVKSLWDARDWPSNDKFEALSRFIIVKTDPLEEVLEMLGWTYNGMVRRTTALRNALAARNLEIREKQP